MRDNELFYPCGTNKLEIEKKQRKTETNVSKFWFWCYNPAGHGTLKKFSTRLIEMAEILGNNFILE